MGFLQKWLTSLFFWNLYRKYYRKGWVVVCKSPTLLNIAFPDNSVEYYVCTFHKHDRMILSGTIPSSQVLRYYGITVYDTHGLPVYSVYDNQLVLNSDKTFRLEIKTSSFSSSSSYYALLVRFYFCHPSPQLHVQYLPKGIQQPSKKYLLETTPIVGQKIISLLSKRNMPEFPYQQQFFLPASQQMAFFFPNNDAVYMIAIPRSSRVMKITGTLPSTIGRSHNLRFIGFMACNFQTTETDASISDRNLSRHYTIWVAYSLKDALKKGYQRNQPLLLWKSTNQYPVLIYREVRITKEGLHALVSETEMRTPKECNAMMKQYYPMIS